jgi:Uma2 family endonuclease
MMMVLHAVCPPDLEVLPAPFDFTPQTGFVLQPDVMVLDPERSERQRTHVAPLLAVEVLSPGTRMKDRVLKRAVYAEHGVPSYWIIDPAEPSLLALELAGDAYTVVTEVGGEEMAALKRPFPVSVVPARLVDRTGDCL